MDTAILSILIGFTIRLAVPFFLLLLLSRSLRQLAERLDNGSVH